MSFIGSSDARLSLDRAAGLLSFDTYSNWTPSRRLKVLWLENRLDCRIWSYYCDLRRAMGQLHDLVTISNTDDPDLIVVGPRMSGARDSPVLDVILFRLTEPCALFCCGVFGVVGVMCGRLQSVSTEN